MSALRPAPSWVRPAAALIRRLPAGRYRLMNWFGVWEVAVFLAILVVGYIWAYKKGALEWV